MTLSLSRGWTAIVQSAGSSLPKTGLLLFFASCLMQTTAQSQWTTSGTTIYNSNTGNVGVGTTTPATKLQVNGVLSVLGGAGSELTGGGGNGLQFIGGYASPVLGRMIIGDNSGWKFHLSSRTSAGTIGDLFTFLDNGNMGIGTANPQTLLDLGELRFGKISSFPAEGFITEGVWGNYILGDVNNAQRLRLGVSNDGSTRAEIFIDNSNRQDGTLTFKTGNGGAAQSRMFIDGNGSVSIGTTNPGTNKLAVEGTIGARKVVVTLSSFADYVFKRGYSLPSLSSVARYIRSNGHLPEMPTADSVQKNGLDLGGNQVVLVKKIEELTLYLIQQNKELEALKQHDKMLKEQNRQLRSMQERINRLEKHLSKK